MRSGYRRRRRPARGERQAQVATDAAHVGPVEFEALLHAFEARQPREAARGIAKQQRCQIDDELIDPPGGEQRPGQPRAALGVHLVAAARRQACEHRVEIKTATPHRHALDVDAVRRQRVVNFEPITEDTPSFVLADSTDVVETVSKQQELELLTRAIQSLPGRCREVFTLRTAYGLTQRQIADKLGVSLSTVEKQFAQGIRLCASFFANGGR